MDRQTALVIGSAGQDGRLLSAQLRERGALVHGLDREADLATVERAVRAAPSAIYYLAAHHRSSEERDDDLAAVFDLSFEVHVRGIVRVLEAVRRHAPATRVFYASSSHVFGRPSTPTQNEDTPRRPDTPYAITKSAGMDVVRFFREAHGIHASCGILYNHESIHRPDKFVSMRVVRAAQRAGRDPGAGPLEIGSFSAVVDWGWAPDYTDAMQRIVAEPAPSDWVVATGEPHTVADFAEVAFASVGLAYRDHVVEKPGIVQRAGVPLVGDASKLREHTGWRPTVSFEEMVRRLVAES